MTPMELSKQEDHLFEVLSGKRFLQMEGLSNEVPFFIYPYAPEDALEVAKSKKRIKNRLSNQGIEVLEINLYDLSVEILKERGVWDHYSRWSREQKRQKLRNCSRRRCSTRNFTSPRRLRQAC